MFRAFCFWPAPKVFHRWPEFWRAPWDGDLSRFTAFIDFDFRLCENPPHRPFSLL